MFPFSLFKHLIAPCVPPSISEGDDALPPSFLRDGHTLYEIDDVCERKTFRLPSFLIEQDCVKIIWSNIYAREIVKTNPTETELCNTVPEKIEICTHLLRQLADMRGKDGIIRVHYIDGSNVRISII
jgi:hypothetical protein